MSKKNIFPIVIFILILMLGAVFHLLFGMTMCVAKYAGSIVLAQTECQAAVFKIAKYKKLQNKYPAELRDCIKNLPSDFPFDYYVNSERNEFCLMFNEQIFRKNHLNEACKWLALQNDFPYPKGFFTKSKDAKTFNIIFDEVVNDPDVVFIDSGAWIFLESGKLHHSRKAYYEKLAKTITDKLSKNNISYRAEFYYFNLNFPKYRDIVEILR